MTQSELNLLQELANKYNNEYGTRNVQTIPQGQQSVLAQEVLSPAQNAQPQSEISEMRQQLNSMYTMMSNFMSSQAAPASAPASAPAPKSAPATVSQAQPPQVATINDVIAALHRYNISATGQAGTARTETIDSVTASIIDPPLPDYGAERNGGKVAYGE